MKYMGSKRLMLQNGLGAILSRELGTARRFVDLFTGSGVVAIYVGTKFPRPVLACDLQRYGAVLAGAIINRNEKIDWEEVWGRWYHGARRFRRHVRTPSTNKVTQSSVKTARNWCGEQENAPVTVSYGGYYFSPLQAVWIDSFRNSLPEIDPARTVALAALIQAASQCVAAPGHTAQPFQPTRTAKPYLAELWGRSVVKRTKIALKALADQCAVKRGRALVADANEAIKNLRASDLVFIDPPYSGVQYSRFYHVLETIACGECGEVSGIGRYPAREYRPQSKYSLKRQSTNALGHLLKEVAARKAKAVLTFPDHECSNGLSGMLVREIAARHFRISGEVVESRFSSLGGTGDRRNNEAGRAPVRTAKELILLLSPH